MNMVPRTCLLSFCLSILIASGVAAQGPSADAHRTNWVRIEAPQKDFSISVPENEYLADVDAETLKIYLRAPNTTIKADIRQDKQAKDQFELSYKFEKEKGFSFSQIGDFLVSQHFSANTKSGLFSFSLHVASSNGSYRIFANTRNAADPVLTRFIDSIRLNGQTLYKPRTEYPADAQTRSVSSLRSDQAILAALGTLHSKQNRLEKGIIIEADTDADCERQVLILRMPKLSVNSAAGRFYNGRVVLKVEFLGTGEIGNISLIKALDPALEKDAFDAAKKIKFLPAQANGRAVNATKLIEFSFSVS